MKIGIVCPYDIARGGGVQEHVLAQAAELSSRGHKIKVLTPKVRHQTKKPVGLSVIYVGSATKVRTPIKTSLELGLSINGEQLDKILADEKFDILHLHEPEVPMLGVQIAAKALCPVVATFHAVLPQTAMGKTLKNLRIPYSKSILSRLDALTAVSEPAAAFVKQRTNRPVHIIPNGIDLERYRFLPVKQGTPQHNILYVGRLEKRKGVIYLLRAYANLAKRRDDISLQLVGEGELLPMLREFVKTKKIPRVSFLGFVSDRQKQKLLHQASLFCSPALFGESFGIVLLEAMASGTVIAAGNNPGYSALLQETGQKSLVDPTRIIDFANRLERLLSDQPLRQQWLSWAKQYVQQFDYKKVVDQYESLYKELLNKQVSS